MLNHEVLLIVHFQYSTNNSEIAIKKREVIVREIPFQEIYVNTSRKLPIDSIVQTDEQYF